MQMLFNRSVRLRPTRTKCCSRMRAGSACNSNEVSDAEAAPSRVAAQRKAERRDGKRSEQRSAAAGKLAAQPKWGAESNSNIAAQ